MIKINGKEHNFSIIQNRKNQKQSSETRLYDTYKPKSNSKPLRNNFSNGKQIIILHIVLRTIVRNSKVFIQEIFDHRLFFFSF